MEDLLLDRDCFSILQDSSHRTILGNLAAGIARLTLTGDWMAVNAPLCDLLGFSSDQLLGTAVTQVLRAHNTDAEREERFRLLSGEIPVYASGMSGERRDGQQIWVKAFFSLVRDAATNQPDHLLVAFEDLTPLRRARRALRNSERAREEVARRLINAQELERTRIARELHDDIGQSLAVLKIQMLRAGRTVSGKSGLTHPGAPQLADQIQAVAEKVSRLSHQLHSAELEFLGLAIAVKSHCREVAERFKITVDCTCDHVPNELDGTLALAFLRVIQESLHNTAKHANAAHATVALTGTGTELDLTVIDDGIGFDSERASSAPGLGLISMRERLHLVGGELSVSSTPGKGTRVHARAPYLAVPEADPENV